MTQADWDDYYTQLARTRTAPAQPQQAYPGYNQQAAAAAARNASLPTVPAAGYFDPNYSMTQTMPGTYPVDSQSMVSPNDPRRPSYGFSGQPAATTGYSTEGSLTRRATITVSSRQGSYEVAAPTAADDTRVAQLNTTTTSDESKFMTYAHFAASAIENTGTLLTAISAVVNDGAVKTGLAAAGALTSTNESYWSIQNALYAKDANGNYSPDISQILIQAIKIAGVVTNVAGIISGNETAPKVAAGLQGGAELLGKGKAAYEQHFPSSAPPARGSVALESGQYDPSRRANVKPVAPRRR
jgi:hypothetical protein